MVLWKINPLNFQHILDVKTNYGVFISYVFIAVLKIPSFLVLEKRYVVSLKLQHREKLSL